MDMKSEKGRENWRAAKGDVVITLRNHNIPEEIIQEIGNTLSKGFAREQERINNALFEAAKEGSPKMADLLADYADLSARDEDGCIPLHGAAENGYIDNVRLLIEKGSDVNAKDYFGKTPLFSAVEKGRILVVALLIERGADVNAKSNDNWTALHEAVDMGHLDSVKLLLEKGADVNAKDKYGNSPIDRAGNDVTIWNILLEAGAKAGKEIASVEPLPTLGPVRQVDGDALIRRMEPETAREALSYDKVSNVIWPYIDQGEIDSDALEKELLALWQQGNIPGYSEVLSVVSPYLDIGQIDEDKFKKELLALWETERK